MTMKKYRSFTKARNYVRLLKLNSSIEWEEYCKSGKKPDDIPVVPRIVFKERWNGFGDWLGTNTIANQVISAGYLPPQEAGPIIRKLREDYGLKNKADWVRFTKTHKKILEKLHLPADPVVVYSLKRAKKRMKK